MSNITGAAPSGPCEFMVPAPSVREPEWRKLVTQFDTWLLTSARYPTVSATKTLSPDYTKIKDLSGQDYLDVYLMLLSGTLSHFFTEGNEKDAAMAWRVLWSLNTQVCCSPKIVAPGKHDAESLFGELARLLERRDVDQRESEAYKRWTRATPPAHQAMAWWHLSVLGQDKCQRSVLTNLDHLLYSLLLVDSSEIAPDGVSDCFLRLVLERAFHKVPAANLDSCFSMEQGVDAILEKLTGSVESQLRYWTFHWLVLKELVLGRERSMSDFVAGLQKIRAEVNALKGVLAFCYVIAPDTRRYLDSNVFAEFLLNSMNARKGDHLIGTWLAQCQGTPILQKLVDGNTHRATMLKKELSGMVGEVMSGRFKWSSHGQNSNLKAVVACARQGDEDAATAVKYLQQKATGTGTVLGQSRFRTLVLRACPVGSAVEALFPEMQYYVAELRRSPPRRTWARLLADAAVPIESLGKLVIDDHEEGDQGSDATPLMFIPKAQSLVAVERADAGLQALNVLRECPICFEDGRHLEMLHAPETRHTCCRTCRSTLMKKPPVFCPYCRVVC